MKHERKVNRKKEINVGKKWRERERERERVRERNHGRATYENF